MELYIHPWEESGDTLSVLRPKFEGIGVGDIMEVSMLGDLSPFPYRLASLKHVSLYFDAQKGIYYARGTPLWFYPKDMDFLGWTMLGVYMWIVLFPESEPYSNIDRVRLEPLRETEPLLNQIEEITPLTPEIPTYAKVS
jgi:hypothetical protein